MLEIINTIIALITCIISAIALFKVSKIENRISIIDSEINQTVKAKNMKGEFSQHATVNRKD